MVCLTKFGLLFIVIVAFSFDKIAAYRCRNCLSEPRIVGGQLANIKNYPYMACINIIMFTGPGQFRCGGSIISLNYILTAAHCLENTKKATVRIGSSSDSSGGHVQTMESKWFSIHPKYNTRTVDYDVGVIQMRIPIKLKGINAAIIPLTAGNKLIKAGTKVNVTGWGGTYEQNGYTNNLKKVTLQTYSNQNCRRIYGLGNGPTNRMFCAGVSQGVKGSWKGDSGSPVVAGGKQIGLVSFAKEYVKPNRPGLYTNISDASIRNWIKTKTKV